MTPHATIDFETRSACSIKKCGSWRYSLDPSTEVLCMAFRLPSWAPGRTGLWHPAFPALGIRERFDFADMLELYQWITARGPVEAHNAWFERGVWTNKMVPEFSFPAVPAESWRCSAAKAAAHALPRKLEDVAVILALDEQKDADGHKLMMKMAKPRKARKAEREEAEESGVPLNVLYFESVEMFDRLCEYCRQDVLTEAAVSEALPDLSPDETQVYVLDQVMNERGFGLDTEAIDSALTLIERETAALNQRLSVVTNGYVPKATARKDLMVWTESEGFPLGDTTKLTVDTTLQMPYVPPVVREALTILQEIGRSSTAKYAKMRDWICPDDRAHGGLLYHGASTGRWSGAGIQPQNFPKGKIKDIEAAWAALKTRDREHILALCDEKGKPLFKTVMEALSWALRGAIVARPGHQLYVADYAAIEARVLPWLAYDDETLDMFRSGADIYCAFASDIYGYPCNKHDHPMERALGKVAVLGLGYQMGWTKFIDTCWVMARIQIDDDLSQRTVDAYRERFWRTRDMWADMEAAAIEAVETGKPVVCGRVVWCMTEGDEGYQFLYCTLPSGRRIAYPDPIIKGKRTPWGKLVPALTFMGISSTTHQWQRQDTYGGSLVENVDQAVSRDLIAASMLRCEQSGLYVPILTVHDELIAEAELGQGDVHGFETLVATCPAWAEGCPVAAEGWRGLRYRK